MNTILKNKKLWAAVITTSILVIACTLKIKTDDPVITVKVVLPDVDAGIVDAGP